MKGFRKPFYFGARDNKGGSNPLVSQKPESSGPRTESKAETRGESTAGAGAGTGQRRESEAERGSGEGQSRSQRFRSHFGQSKEDKERTATPAANRDRGNKISTLPAGDRNVKELYDAVRSKNVEKVRGLLVGGASINGRFGIFERSALHQAAKDGNITIVEELLNHGTSPITQPKEGGLGVEKKIATEEVTEVEKGGTRVTEAKDEDGPAVVVKREVDVDATDRAGRTALHEAAEGGHDKVVGSLIKAGANITLKDRAGWTPLHRAADKGKLEAVDVLLKSAEPTKAGKTGLFKSRESDRRTALLKAKDDTGRTALHRAAIGGYKDVVIRLLEAAEGGPGTSEPQGLGIGHGIDGATKPRGPGDEPGAGGATESQGPGGGHKAGVATEPHGGGGPGAGGATESQGPGGGPRTGGAAKPQGYEGASDTGSISRSGAANSGSTNDRGIDKSNSKSSYVKMGDKNGRTALCCAAERGRGDVVRELLEAGADISAKDLGVAAENGSKEVTEMLLRKFGTSVDLEKLRDDSGKTALHWAAEKGNLEVVELLLQKDIKGKEPDRDAGPEPDPGKLRRSSTDITSNLAGASKLINASINRFKGGGKTGSSGATPNASDTTEAVDKKPDLPKPAQGKSKRLLNATTTGGLTALDLAAANGQSNVVSFLLGKDADFRVVGKDGLTALDRAFLGGHRGVALVITEKLRKDELKKEKLEKEKLKQKSLAKEMKKEIEPLGKETEKLKKEIEPLEKEIAELEKERGKLGEKVEKEKGKLAEKVEKEKGDLTEKVETEKGKLGEKVEEIAESEKEKGKSGEKAEKEKRELEEDDEGKGEVGEQEGGNR